MPRARGIGRSRQTGPKVGTRLVWHYTVGALMDPIRAAGELACATENVPPGEKPVLWFSARQHWEPTANKGFTGSDGVQRLLSFEETIAYGKGGYRFGVAPEGLIPWRLIPEQSGMSDQMKLGLVRSAKSVGADPSFWYGSMTPIPISNCVVQRLNGDEWIDERI